MKIKHSQVTYLACVLNENLSREPMALKALNILYVKVFLLVCSVFVIQ